MSQKNLIETDNVQLAKDIQQKFHEVMNSALFLEDLEALFNGAAGDKNWVYLDKLELDLGNLSPKISIEELKKRLIKEMSNGISGAGINSISETKQPISFKASEQVKIEKALMISKLEEAWISFITHQILPENFHFRVQSLTEFISVSEEILKQEKKIFGVWFVSLALKVNQERLAHMPLSFWGKIILKTGRFSKEETTQFKTALKSIKKKAHRLQAKELIIYFLVNGVIAEKGIETSQKIVADETLTGIKKVVQKLEELETFIQKETSAQRKKRLAEIQKEVKTAEEKKPAEKLEKREENKSPFVANAGMSLLFPFLPEVFKKLKYTKEDKLIRPGRALCFLSFIEHGKEVFAPHRSLLYKVVCGLPENYFTNGENKLTKKEKNEAKELIASAIEHWKALKNTTPSGLREAFLQREGKLIQKGFDYHLKVEQKAQDVLLSRVPWSFGVIRLPWMTNFLHIDW